MRGTHLGIVLVVLLLFLVLNILLQVVEVEKRADVQSTEEPRWTWLEATKPLDIGEVSERPRGAAATRYTWVVSTGHVGTSSLLSACRKRHNNIQCLQEHWKDARSTSKEFAEGVYTTFRSSYERSLELMKTVYLPLLQDQFGNKRVYDSGRHLTPGWQYFALCELVGQNMTLVRLRRDEIGSGRSLCHEKKSGWNPAEALKPNKLTRYEVIVSTPDAILALPSEVYEKLSCFQRAVWEIREQEARYQYARRHMCKEVPFLELNWEGEEFLPAQRKLSEFIPELAVEAEEHVRPHAMDEDREFFEEHMKEVEEQLEELSELIEAHYVPWGNRGWTDWEEGDLP